MFLFVVFEAVSNARNLYSKVENPGLVTENGKQTFGDKRNLVDPFPGEENGYEIQVWAYSEVHRKREKMAENHCI